MMLQGSYWEFFFGCMVDPKKLFNPEGGDSKPCKERVIPSYKFSTGTCQKDSKSWIEYDPRYDDAT